MTRSLGSQSGALCGASECGCGRWGSEALSDSTRGVLQQRRLPADSDGGGIRLGRGGRACRRDLDRLSTCAVLGVPPFCGRWGASRHLLQAHSERRGKGVSLTSPARAGKDSGDPWTTLGTTSCPGVDRKTLGIGGGGQPGDVRERSLVRQAPASLWSTSTNGASSTGSRGQPGRP